MRKFEEIMDGSLAAFAIFNIFVNSLLAFALVQGALVLIFRLFPLLNHRLRALFTLAPFLKLITVVCCAAWTSWAVRHGINPFECEEGTRRLTAEFFPRFIETFPLSVSFNLQFSVYDFYVFSAADLLGFWLGPYWVRMISSLLVLATVVRWLFSLQSYFCKRRALRQLIKTCRPCRFSLQSASLQKALQKRRVRVCESSTFSGSPFITGGMRPVIVLPEKLLTRLNAEEIEAVLAHELAHAERKDPCVRLLCTLLSEIFWWIPLKKAFKRMEDCQEFACDDRALFYVSPVALAGALQKTARSAAAGTLSLTVLLLQKGALVRRVQNILQKPQSARFPSPKRAQGWAACIILSCALFGKFLGL